MLYLLLLYTIATEYCLLSVFRGSDFRLDYSHLNMLCPLFPNVPVLALTATANKQDIKQIKDSLCHQECIDVIANPYRENIFYAKHFRKGQDIDNIEEILKPIAQNLLLSTINYPITVVYLPIRWCGFAYTLFESVLANHQYYPAIAPAIPKNRLFGQFHAPQTDEMKEEILRQLTSSQSPVRVVFQQLLWEWVYIYHRYVKSSTLVHHIQFKHFTRKQEEMEDLLQLFYIITTGTFPRTNQACKIW